jgi:hypothetical protein
MDPTITYTRMYICASTARKNKNTTDKKRKEPQLGGGGYQRPRLKV